MSRATSHSPWRRRLGRRRSPSRSPVPAHSGQPAPPRNRARRQRGRAPNRHCATVNESKTLKTSIGPLSVVPVLTSPELCKGATVEPEYVVPARWYAIRSGTRRLATGVPKAGHQLVAGARRITVVAARDRVVLAQGQHVEGLLGVGRGCSTPHLRRLSGARLDALEVALGHASDAAR